MMTRTCWHTLTQLATVLSSPLVNVSILELPDNKCCDLKFLANTTVTLMTLFCLFKNIKDTERDCQPVQFVSCLSVCQLG